MVFKSWQLASALCSLSSPGSKSAAAGTTRGQSEGLEGGLRGLAGGSALLDPALGAG